MIEYKSTRGSLNVKKGAQAIIKGILQEKIGRGLEGVADLNQGIQACLAGAALDMSKEGIADFRLFRQFLLRHLQLFALGADALSQCFVHSNSPPSKSII